MADYSIPELLAALQAAGFSGAALYVMAAISLAENTARNLTAVNTAGNSPAGSRDRGPVQINDYWHADVPDSCAFDLACAARAAYKISSQGRSFSPWSVYNSGAYLSKLPLVQGVTPSPIVADSASATSPTSTPVGFSITNPIGSAVNAALGGLIGDFGKVALTAVFVLGGIGLVVAGLYQSTVPKGTATGVAKKAAMAAAL